MAPSPVDVGVEVSERGLKKRKGCTCQPYIHEVGVESRDAAGWLCGRVELRVLGFILFMAPNILVHFLLSLLIENRMGSKTDMEYGTKFCIVCFSTIPKFNFAFMFSPCLVIICLVRNHRENFY